MINNDVEQAHISPAKDYHDPPPSPLFEHDELTKWSFYRAIIVEFVATLLFLYTTISTIIGHKSQIDPNSGGDKCGGVGLPQSR
ncbi:hypothetical protein Leryth_009508 [Lithospermum erythrorhizon]|nr:hypothetical protein Leryth_009508 [Lithospermum erythrorhizon]